MSQPPEYPGRQRLKRAAAQAGSDAYQGAFEAVGSVLVACGVGFWVDRQWETAPYGVLVGAVVGFAAMVLRLLRLGKELHPDGGANSPAGSVEEVDDDRAIGESPGISDALRVDATSQRDENETSEERSENEEPK